MMQERPFALLSVEDLASSAGLSRSAFYFYFSLKDDVLLALLHRVLNEAEERVAMLPRAFEPDPEAAWRRVIDAYVEVFASHRAVAVATLTARLHNAQIDELWSSSMTAWVRYTTEAIACERLRGVAAPGLDARNLAIALNLMNERVISSVFVGEDPFIPESDVAGVLTSLWLQTIYGRMPLDLKP